MLQEEIVKKLSSLKKEDLTDESLHKIKKEKSKNQNLKSLPSNIQLQKAYEKLVKNGEISENPKLKFLLMKRKIRSLSGIVPIQVLTKPRPCPGKCIFCPNETIMPKSYISTEPGAMRALLNDFDPLKQVYNRLLSLQNTGHNTDKIEMIVLGGSFDAYPHDYKLDFIKKLYDACNSFEKIKHNFQVNANNPKSARFTIDLDKLDIDLSIDIEQAHAINENAENRIIGLTVETRPDLVTEKNVQFWRKIGVTRLEIGIESVFDDVLDANKRGHKIEEVRKALHLIRKYGFKFSVHMMSGLYKSTLEKDIKNFKILFEDDFLKPDELKFYPTSVIPNTELYQLYKKGEYIPSTNEDIIKIVNEIKEKYIPPYTRIKRLIRDIPSTEIVAGSSTTNLRQMIVHNMKKNLKLDKTLQKQYQNRNYPNAEIINIENFEKIQIENFDFETLIFKNENTILRENSDLICLCTRCREVRNQKEESDIILVLRKYKSSVGEEYFISFEDNFGYLIGFVRLLLPIFDFSDFQGLGKDTAIVRELHVYGPQEKIGQKGLITQHRGFGTKLMKLAEHISKKRKYAKISVISGVGVRGFYKKIGYELEGTYMKKDLDKD